MQAAFSHQDVQRKVMYIHWFVIAPQASESRKTVYTPWMSDKALILEKFQRKLSIQAQV